MNYFSNHSLVRQPDGSFELFLYLEFKQEIGKLPLGKVLEQTISIQESAKKYIADNLPGVRISAIRIMLGTVLVTSIMAVYPATLNDGEPNSYVNPGSVTPPIGNEYPHQQLPGTGIIPKPSPTTKPGSATPGSTAPTEVTPPNMGTKLVLVNKKYHLPSTYVPAHLVAPQVRFTFAEDLPQRYMTAEAAQALEKLFNQAEQEDVILKAVSGYRSYQRQAEIFARNSAQSPDANRFSARAGQSEHQTGLAMDVTNTDLETLSQSFGATMEGQWLRVHAAEFGFIIRYPVGKEALTGYAYEPWHLRYVGVEAAQAIMNSNITLEQYLGLI